MEVTRAVPTNNNKGSRLLCSRGFLFLRAVTVSTPCFLLTAQGTGAGAPVLWRWQLCLSHT